MQDSIMGRPKLLRSINRSHILDCLRDHGPLSRVDLARETHLSLPAVSRATSDLLAEGLLVELGSGASSGGRRPTLLGLNPRAGYAVGVDLGATKMAVGIVDLAGQIVWQDQQSTWPNPADGFPGRPGWGTTVNATVTENHPVVTRLIQLIRGAIDGAHISRDAVRGVGVGVPGITNEDGTLVRDAPGLGWHEVPLSRWLEQSLGLPSVLDNDVNMVTLGEKWAGAARRINDAVCVMVGTGIGAGILIGGQLYRGARQAAGEIGYWLISVPPDGVPGQSAAEYGQLERTTAGSGIWNRWIKRRGEGGLEGSGEQGAGTAEPVFRAAASGDMIAREVLRETAQVLGCALTNVTALLNPARIILGGGVMAGWDVPVTEKETFGQHLERSVRVAAPDPPEVVRSSLGTAAGILGAAFAVFEQSRRSLSFHESR